MLSSGLLAIFIVGGTFVYTWFRWQSVKNCKEYDYAVDTAPKSCYSYGARGESIMEPIKDTAQEAFDKMFAGVKQRKKDREADLAKFTKQLLPVLQQHFGTKNKTTDLATELERLHYRLWAS